MAKAEGGSGEGETVVVTRHVKEWQPNSNDSLAEIEATIDSWGRDGSGSPRAGLQEAARSLDITEVEAKVDKITKRVKATRKVEVTETVTEWVEGPVGSGPMAVEADPQEDDAWSGSENGAKPAEGKRPKRRFSLFGRKKDKDKAEPKPAPGKDYQPQCGALTEDGQQCRNSAREGSKYCAPHKGYQPPTAKGLAQRIEGDAWDPDDDVTDRQSARAVDTRPAVGKAKDTRLRTRKARKAGKPSNKKR